MYSILLHHLTVVFMCHNYVAVICIILFVHISYHLNIMYQLVPSYYIISVLPQLL